MSFNHDENKINSSRTGKKRSDRSSGSAKRKRASSVRNYSVKSDREISLSNMEKKISAEEEFFDNYRRFDDNTPVKKNPSSKEKQKKKQPQVKIRELTSKQRKIRMNIMYIAMFIVIVLVAAAFSFTVIFKTNDIQVEGKSCYPEDDIIETSGLYIGENIFLSPKKAAAKKIVDTYPYIESAEITAKIPGTQVITIEGAIPSYEVSINGGYVVISSKGRVLAHNDERTPSIPLLKGVRVKDTEVGEYIKFEKSATEQILQDIINNINSNNIPNIYGIDISNAANIKLNYGNRITISLGVPEDVGYKLRTAMVIINDELSETDRGDLDVSLANSDRKASYFTPIYSNTITMDDTVKSSDTDSSDTDFEKGESKTE